jgi:hypothetical protein
MAATIQAGADVKARFMAATMPERPGLGQILPTRTGYPATRRRNRTKL